MKYFATILGPKRGTKVLGIVIGKHPTIKNIAMSLVKTSDTQIISDQFTRLWGTSQSTQKCCFD